MAAIAAASELHAHARRKIGAVIHALADELGYGVVEKFVGHGWEEFPARPTVRHHRNNGRSPPRARRLSRSKIEPMLTIGKSPDAMWKDEWTAVTKDGMWTAQCAPMLVTETGVEILDGQRPKGCGAPCSRATNSERGPSLRCFSPR